MVLYIIKKINDDKGVGFIATQQINKNTIIHTEDATEIIYESFVCTRCVTATKFKTGHEYLYDASAS